MYKVLVVEDEPNIRGGIVRHSMWGELGLTDVEEADDGTTALERVRAQPDIRLVLTDIRMKKMSGLELIARLYDELAFQGKVIVLSGYDDFHYARTAMTYGVQDYLVKPVDMAELKEAVARAFERMAREERQSVGLRMMERAMPKLKEQLLQQLLGEPAGAAAAANALQSHGLSWIASSRLAMLVLEPDHLPAEEAEEKERELALFAAGNVLEHTLRETVKAPASYALFRSVRRDGWIAAFGQPSSASADWAWLRDLKATLRTRMSRYVKRSASIAVVVDEGDAGLSGLYKEAMDELSRIRLYGDDDGREEAFAPDTVREVDLLSGPQALADLLKHGGAADVRKAAAQFPHMVREWGIGRVRDLQQRLFEWLLALFEAARKAGWKQDYWRKNPLRLWSDIQAYDTAEALQEQVETWLLQINAELQEAPRNQVLQLAERYIREHVAEPLTVQTIAEQVYVSPEWLSTLFRKHYDMTVLDYITRLRMEKAKTLLQDVGLKIYQISGMTGYKDTVYFSRLFRKHTGLTPAEYRNQRGIGADE